MLKSFMCVRERQRERQGERERVSEREREREREEERDTYSGNISRYSLSMAESTWEKSAPYEINKHKSISLIVRLCESRWQILSVILDL